FSRRSTATPPTTTPIATGTTTVRPTSTATTPTAVTRAAASRTPRPTWSATGSAPAPRAIRAWPGTMPATRCAMAGTTSSVRSRVTPTATAADRLPAVPPHEARGGVATAAPPFSFAGTGRPQAVACPAPVTRQSAMSDKHRPSREQAEDAVRTLLAWAGEDPAREGLVDTPRRVVEAYGDWFSGYEIDPDEYMGRT